METCMRGFSYMPEKKIEVNLQFTEHEELERAWKVSRRQRVKEQEQRIWEEFVKEQDIVQKAYTEDPYQFLHDLPENCLKELMEAELLKMKKSSQEEPTDDPADQGEGDHPAEKQVVHMVTFADDEKSGDTMDTFHIFDDENDVNLSGAEEDDDAPDTVRERSSEEVVPADHKEEQPLPDPQLQEKPAAHPAPPARHSPKRPASAAKAPETVSNVIESSIYCARVKDIRLKIGEEMTAIMASLEVQNVVSIDRSEVARRCKRAAEFCARFNRIYMYQLQRQAQNIKRHVSQSLPLAQHTQFQSQMLRVVSLHQNMLQALQVFHKSFSATSCLRECVRALVSVCAFVRDASALCRAVPPPKDFVAAQDLYSDELLHTCDKLDDAVNEYGLRVADLICSDEHLSADAGTTPPSSRTRKTKKNTVSKTPASKSWSTKDTDARLSMYSLDTMRLNLHAKSSGSRENQSSGTSRGRASPDTAVRNRQQRTDREQGKVTKRVIRRPLMRAPQTYPVRARPSKDMDISTMVEAVDTCESSQVVSRCQSPRNEPSPRRTTPRVSTPRVTTPRVSTPRVTTPRVTTPRRVTPRHATSVQTTPTSGNPSPRQRSPRPPKVHPNLKATTRCATASSPLSQPHIKKSLSSIKSETVTATATATAKTSIAPVSKIQCAKKMPDSGRSTDRTLERNTHRSLNGAEKKGHRSPNRTEKRSHQSPNRTEKRSHRSPNRYEKRTERKTTERSDNNTDRSLKHEKISPRSPRDMCSKGDRLNNENCAQIRPGHSGNAGKENNAEEFCGVKELTDFKDDYSKCYAKEVEEERSERSRSGSMSSRCDVTWLLKQLCSGDPACLSDERITGAKNAQLLCIRGGSPPRQPSTPQLLRILEETIQKQAPKPMYEPQKPKNPERFRLNFNIGEATASRLFQYRTKFVQHMLTSPLYANSAVGKPWEMIGGVSDSIIDELLTRIATEMEVQKILLALYKSETN